MGDDFLPYLDGVMPPLLQLASAKADVRLLDGQSSYQQLQEKMLRKQFR